MPFGGKNMNSTPASESQKPRLLIVDDEVAQMTALCHTLNDRGYETVGTSSPSAALATLAAGSFDLLLSDLMMPEMDGIALLKEAQKIDKDLVAIIMTGEGTIVTAVEAMKSGAFDYILKPFKVSVILPVLARALDVRRLRIQNAVLARSVRERTAELEVANTELEAFSFTVSHDLRAPLRHIAGFAELLETELAAVITDDGRHYLSMISKSATRLSTLIEDLLTFSRTGRAEMNRTTVDMGGQVRQVLEELGPDLAGRTVEFDIGILPAVHGDPALLHQVWVNLLANAVKYSRKREVSRIQVSAQESAEEVVFTVKDNGAGFDNRYAERLFGVFQRLHTADEFEGVGVGLANVRRIVSRHGGKTWAEGRLDEGASFFFSLPR